MDQAEYQKKYKVQVERYESIENGLAEINDKRLENNGKVESIVEFIWNPKKINTLMAVSIGMRNDLIPIGFAIHNEDKYSDSWSYQITS